MSDVLDTTVDDQIVDDQPELPAESYDDEPEIEELEQHTQQDKVDGRKFNPEWSKALKELRELYPDKADMLTKLRDEYGRMNALREIAPNGLEDAKAWKTTLDALGGAEAAADMMQRVASYDAIDQKILSSDVTAIDDLPEEMQKGFYGMIPEALSRLAESDQNAFNAAVAPHFKSALAATGMGDHLKAMYEAAGDNEQLKGLIKQQFDWFQQQTQGAGKMPEGRVTPQQSRAEKELATLREGQESQFVQGVVDTSNKFLTETFDKSVDVYVKQLNLSDSQKSDLLESFNAKLTTILGGDTAFQKQLAAYKANPKRDSAAVNQYIQANIAKHAKSTLDGLVTARYGKTANRRAPAATTTATTNGGATRVAQAPSQDQWDMEKMEAMGYENTAKKGVYHLKSGKTVQLARPN